MKALGNTMAGILSLSSLVPVAAFATTGYWNNGAADSTPLAPLIWDNEGNWDDDFIPKTASDDADFFTHVASSTTRWIKMPDTLSVRSITHKKASGNLRLIGGDLALNGSFTTSTSSGSNYARIYADITASAAITFQYADICGDLKSQYQITFGYGYGRLRTDLYANAAGETRTNPGPTYSYSASYGEFAIYAPQGSDDDIAAAWTLRNGSTFATRPSGTAAHALCAGTVVTAPNGELPAGTFLKRIFDDGTIELSAPASLGADTVDVELTFAAFSPKVSQTLGQFNHTGTKDPLYIDLSKYREKDELRFTVNNFSRPSAEESCRVVLTSTTGVPGTLVLRAARFSAPVEYRNCHVEFAMPEQDGYKPGLPFSAATKFYGSSSQARMTVTNNLTARITTITNFVGTLVKDGAGTLTTTLSNSFNSAGAMINTGTLKVEEGTFKVLANGDGSTSGVAHIAIGANGTLAIPESGFAAKTLSFEAGARLSGGKLVISEQTDCSGLVLVDGASVECVVDTSGAGSARVINSVEPFVASNKPAFWVDARNADSFVGFTEGETQYVSRWNDTRGEGYMFATNTNVGVAYPQRIVNDATGQCYLYINNRATAKIDEMELLVWNVPLDNIRAVFMVRDPAVGCGQALLGATKRLGVRNYDFRRNAAQGKNIESSLFQANLHACVKNGRHYMNGEATTWDSKYPVGKYTAGSDAWYRYVVQEVHTTDNACADCFGALYPGTTTETNFNGWDSIAECIIYTNELTYAERLGVADYLMKKWCGSEVTFERFGAEPSRIESIDVKCATTVSVPEGAVQSVDTVTATDAGSITKGGDGELYIDDCVAPNLDVCVAKGVLTIRSVKPSRGNLPAGAYVHFDATDSDTLELEDHDEDGVADRVNTWADCRGTGHLSATASTTNMPTLKTATIAGREMKLVDFGPKMSSSGTTLIARETATSMTFDYTSDARTLALVIGSANGGGYIAGSTKASTFGGIPRKNGGASASDPLYAGSGVPQRIGFSSFNNRPGGTRARINRQSVNVSAAGLSGGYDLVTLAASDAFGLNALSAYNYAFQCGGQEIGEAIYWERKLSEESIARVETYLNEKWFGVEPPVAYRGAYVGDLDIAGGATVRVEGGSPLVVKSLSGAGTLQGSVAFAADASVVAFVETDGSVRPINVSGIDLSSAVTVEFAGSVSALRPGRHVLVSSPSISAGDACAWTAGELPHGRQSLVSFRTEDGALVLFRDARGAVIHLR